MHGACPVAPLSADQCDQRHVYEDWHSGFRNVVYGEKFLPTTVMETGVETRGENNSVVCLQGIDYDSVRLGNSVCVGVTITGKRERQAGKALPLLGHGWTSDVAQLRCNHFPHFIATIEAVHLLIALIGEEVRCAFAGVAVIAAHQ